MSRPRIIVPFRLRYDRRWPTKSGVTGEGLKWYRVYLDGVEYGRLCVSESGGAHLCTPDGYDTICDLSTMQDFCSIRECLHGSKDQMPAIQEVLF